MKKLFALFLGLAACGTDSDHTTLREALDSSQVSLADTVAVAETSVQHSAGVRAALDPSEQVFRIQTVAVGARHDIQVDLAGQVVAAVAAGAAPDGCGTTISLADALARAEAEVGGAAVAVVPDDDDACLREIQVLVDTTLWEIKLGPDGALIEKELSDETL